MNMQIIQLTREQFDEFAIQHKNRNYYQTSQYGELLNRHGLVDHYLALMDDNHKIVAASLILTKKWIGNYQCAYAPRGFLIDFNDLPLLTTFTKLIKQYLSKFGFIYLKIDPPIMHVERDKKGNQIEGGINNSYIIDNLKSLNYQHFGFNLYFETLKPRWNAITKISSSAQRLFTLLDKPLRNKIRRAERKGIVVYKGNQNDIKLFYSLIEKKHAGRKLNYYLDYYELFSKKDMFDLYFAKLDTAIYLKNSKDLYEEELKRNGELANMIQSNTKNNTNIINEKMESDKLLAIYKEDIVNSNNMYKSYPEGVVIATTAVVKYEKELFFLIDGYNPKFKSFSPNHYLRWKVMEEYAQKGYLYIHHNAITGNFDKTTNKFYGIYEFKIEFNSDVVEYIGEFDLIINPQMYSIYKNLRPLQIFINNSLRKQ